MFLWLKIFIIDHRTGTFKFYKMEKSITKDNVVQYYGYWKDNLLKALLRSELLPVASSDDSIEVTDRIIWQLNMVRGLLEEIINKE